MVQSSHHSALWKSLPREQYRHHIEDGLSQLGTHNRNVIVLYGRSDLRWKLGDGLFKDLTNEHQCIRLNGYGIKTDHYSPSKGAIRFLRNKLVQLGVDTSCFDIAL